MYAIVIVAVLFSVVILYYTYTAYQQNQAIQQQALELQEVQEMALLKQSPPKQEMFNYKYAY